MTTKNPFLYLAVILLLTSTQVISQSLLKKVRLSGQIGAYYETYKISGRKARRPPNTGRIYIRPTLDLFGLQFGLEADIFGTTEQRYRVQNLNRYAINPKWNWGSLNLGDYVPRWSQLTLGGVQLRGGGIEINPGIFRFSTVGGQVLKSSHKTGREAYKRTQYGASLGIGRQSSSFFDLMFLRTWDDPDSFVPDTSRRYPITPQENLVIATNTQLNLFKRRFRFQGEFAGCLHNQDVRASEVEIGRVKDAFGGLFTPRFSSRFDYAYSLQSTVQLSSFTFRGDMKYIGPGYTSLGLAYLLNDRKSYSLGFNAKLLKKKVMFRGNFRSQHDNLLDQKMFTTTRNATNIGLNLRPTTAIFMGLNANLNNIGNDTQNDTLRVDTAINGYTVISNFSFPLRNWSTNLNTTYAYQSSRDKNPLRKTSDVAVHNVNLMYSIQFSSVLSGNSSFNFSSTKIAEQDASNILGYGIGFSHFGFSRKLSTSLNLTLNNSESGRSIGIVLSSNLRLTAKDNFSISFRNIGYVPDEEETLEEEDSASILPKKYNETIFTLRFIRRF